jgi:hypothetical protein
MNHVPATAGPRFLSIAETEAIVAHFLTRLPPETDATLVALILIREGLSFFAHTRGPEVAAHTAEAVLEGLCRSGP